MIFYKANQSYNATLNSDYTAGDNTLGVTSVPINTPTIITVARGTDKETRFNVTGTGVNQLTGVVRRDGANVNIPSGSSVECMNDEEFLNQLSSVVFDQEGLQGLIYAADGGASDAYEIDLVIEPATLADLTGVPIIFKANTANTGACTLKVNDLAATDIKKNVSVALDTGDILEDQLVLVIYDGTVFQLLSHHLVTESGILLADNTTNDVSATKHGFVPKHPNDATKVLLGDGSFGAVPSSGTGDGWTAVTPGTYASANTINVPSGAASIYRVGDKFKYTQTTDKYGYIVAVADTLLTLGVNDTYSVANATITAMSYSHQDNPIGFPHWLPITLTLTGFTTTVQPTCRYRITGRTMELFIPGTFATSNATTMTLTGLPMTIVNFPTRQMIGTRDNGTDTPTAHCTGSGTTLTFTKDWAGSSFTNSGQKGVMGGYIMFEV